MKRGYHMHYGALGDAVLERPVLDIEGGFILAPMARGIRLTTGAEFAPRDAPPTPVQIDRAEALARRFFPLAERADAAPWMGSRPCLPDMLPVISRAPRHRGPVVRFRPPASRPDARPGERPADRRNDHRGGAIH